METHYAMRLMTEFEGGVGYLLKDRVSDVAGSVADIRRVAREECVIDADNRALSRELYLSAKTFEAHVRSIFTKLDLPPDEDDHRRVLAVLAFLRSS